MESTCRQNKALFLFLAHVIKEKTNKEQNWVREMFESNRLKPPDHESYNNQLCTITADGQKSQTTAFVSFYS